MLSKIIMKEKLLFIIRPNKICGTQLGNVFLFVQIYSIYTDFHQQTTTNRVQVNIPNESKTFMGKTIHTLGVPMFIKLVTHCGVLLGRDYKGCAFILRLEQKNRTRVLYRTILCLNHGSFSCTWPHQGELGHKHPITLPLFLPVRHALILTRGGGVLESRGGRERCTYVLIHGHPK